MIVEGPYLVDGRPTAEAEVLYKALRARLDELRGYAAAKLLELYNDAWLDDDIGRLDHAGFAAHLTAVARRSRRN